MRIGTFLCDKHSLKSIFFGKQRQHFILRLALLSVSSPRCAVGFTLQSGLYTEAGVAISG